MSTTYAPCPAQHHHRGAVRERHSAGLLPPALRTIGGAGAAGSLLLTVIVAALLVVANQIIDAWTEGHLLAAWIVLWTVVFAALALLAAPARRTANALRAATRDWNERRMRAAEDGQYWQAALTDARIMADVSRAMSAAALEDTRGSPRQP